MSHTMAGTYRIAATPLLYSYGPFEGKLQGVSFTAVSPLDVKEWFANNCGQFEMEFSKLMPLTAARELVFLLMRGREIELPALYNEREFESGFIFEWPVAHNTSASQFAQQLTF